MAHRTTRGFHVDFLDGFLFFFESGRSQLPRPPTPSVFAPGPAAKDVLGKKQSAEGANLALHISAHELLTGCMLRNMEKGEATTKDGLLTFDVWF